MSIDLSRNMLRVLSVESWTSRGFPPREMVLETVARRMAEVIVQRITRDKDRDMPYGLVDVNSEISNGGNVQTTEFSCYVFTRLELEDLLKQVKMEAVRALTVL